MLTNTNEWSHTRGNAVVPSRWQATGDGACRRSVREEVRVCLVHPHEILWFREQHRDLRDVSKSAVARVEDGLAVTQCLQSLILDR